MKTFNILLSISCFALFCACKKQVVQQRLTDLQYKWLIDSAVIYSNEQFSGTGTRIPGIEGYKDIRINGIAYSYVMINNAGVVHSYYDTSYYVPKLDMTSMMVYQIINGRSSLTGDSLIINNLSNKQLIVSNTTLHQNGYLRVFFHR